MAQLQKQHSTIGMGRNEAPLHWYYFEMLYTIEVSAPFVELAQPSDAQN